jgi:hypothetical protein
VAEPVGVAEVLPARATARSASTGVLVSIHGLMAYSTEKYVGLVIT